MSTNEQRTHSKWEKFLGEDENWRQWSTYTKAVGRKSGWWVMFEIEHTIDYALTGDDDKLLQQKNDDSSFYLTSTCKGLAFPYVECAGGNAFLTWKHLKERYHDVNEDDLVKLNEKFAGCKLEDLTGDPKIWFIDLEWLCGGVQRLRRLVDRRSPTLR
jgi:hypothetical protein